MCGGESGIVTDVRGQGNITCWCLCTDNFAFALKLTNNLNAEVNLYLGGAICSMMVQKTIMPVGSQTLVATQKLPDEIKCRLPCAPNVSGEYAASHGSKMLRTNSLCDNLITHRILFVS
jgi:hypothetical protein